MGEFWMFIGWMVVIGGACWTGAKVAFCTTLFLQAIFGKATRNEQKHIVYVQRPPEPYYYQNHHHYQNQNGVVIDVEPRR